MNQVQGKWTNRLYRMSPTDRRRFWRRMVAGWQQSGLSVMDYCKSRGLSNSSLLRWKRLFDSGQERFAPRLGQGVDPRPPRKDGGEAVTGSFLPVKVVTRATQRPQETAAGLEIILNNARKVIVRSEFDPNILAKIVSVLEGLSC